MMELGLGTDIIAVARIASLLERWSDRFLNRVFTADEIAYCRTKRYQAEHFAARFAAKEALIKALGVNAWQRINMLNMEVQRTAGGAPYFELSGSVAQLADKKKIDQIKLSMSHCREYAMAVVVLEKEAPLAT